VATSAHGNSGSPTFTALLKLLREGDDDAFDRLFPLVYRRLHTIAHIQRVRSNDQNSLNTTALVHELYIKLSGRQRLEWQDRAHFLAVAATAMRHILIDHARSRIARKRGGGSKAIRLDDIHDLLEATPGLTDERLDALVALDDSLTRLAAENPRQHRIVECRFFGGMTVRDTAEALGISAATVKRGWSMALAWLYRDLKQSMQIEDMTAERLS